MFPATGINKPTVVSRPAIASARTTAAKETPEDDSDGEAGGSDSEDEDTGKKATSGVAREMAKMSL